jgi:hypothetical protein
VLRGVGSHGDHSKAAVLELLELEGLLLGLGLALEEAKGIVAEVASSALALAGPEVGRVGGALNKADGEEDLIVSSKAVGV